MAKYDSELVNQKLINRFTGTHSKGENNADLVNQRLLQRLTAGYINAQPQTQDVLSSKVVSKALPVVKQPEKSQAYDYSVSLKNVLSRQKQGQDTHLMQEYLAQGKTGLDNAYVQIGAYADKSNAEAQVKAAKAKGFDAFIKEL